MKEKKKEKSKAFKVLSYVVTGILSAVFLLIAVGQIMGLSLKSKNNGQSLSFGVFGNFIVLTDSMEPEYPEKTAIVTYKESPEKIYSLYLENQKYNEPIQKEYEKKLSQVQNQEETIALLEEMESKEKHIDITFMDIYSGYRNVKPSRDTHDPILSNLNDPVQVSSSVMSVPIMTHRLREIQIDDSKEEGEGRYTFITSGTNIGGHYSQMGQYQAFTEEELLGVVKINSPILGGFFQFITSVWGLLVLLLIPALYLIISSIKDILDALKEKEESSASEEKNKELSLDSLSKEEQERLKSEMLEEMLQNKDKK